MLASPERRDLELSSSAIQSFVDLPCWHFLAVWESPAEWTAEDRIAMHEIIMYDKYPQYIQSVTVYASG